MPITIVGTEFLGFIIFRIGPRLVFNHMYGNKMKILFVDDEPYILEGIERSLFHLSDTWDINTAVGGENALDELRSNADEPYEVVVSDLRMPGVDGAELLSRISEEFPGIVRIVLSGYADSETAFRAIPVAHQFLSKPCDAQHTEDTVKRACELQSLLNDVVKQAVCQIKQLPSVPALYMKLMELVNDPDSNLSSIGQIIRQDPAMCAKLLKLANSSLFGTTTQFKDINQAIVHLGINTVKNLVMTVEVFNAPPGEITGGYSVVDIQTKALATVRLASMVLPDKDKREELFLSTMLHDVGELVLASAMPPEFNAALESARSSTSSSLAAEMQLLNVSHAEIGAYLLDLWGISRTVVEAVAHHHQPQRLTAHTGLEIVDAIYIADCLYDGIDMDEAYLAELGVLDRLEEWQAQAQELITEFDDPSETESA